MRRRHPGFTLIELLIVIAIISLLTGLLVIGVGKMSRTMKAKATAADLENIQGFFDEMNAHAGMNTKPVVWVWRNLNSPTYTNQWIDPTQLPTSGMLPLPDFWRVPNMVQLAAGGAYTKDSIEAQGSIADLDGSGMEILRNGSQAVLNTQLAMRILLSYPGNKAALAKLPADRLFIPNWVAGPFTGSTNPMAPVTGADGLSDTAIDNGADTVTNVVYAVNNCVRSQGATYRCTAAHVATAANGPPAPTTPPVAPASNPTWIQDADPTPLILDAWGNPLIFIPASGLINVYTGNRSGTDATSTIAVIPGTNTSTIVPAVYARSLPPIQSPDNRPFFVSAGPDGDLTTGDDNIYSFSK